jgi:hypothetical protein
MCVSQQTLPGEWGDEPLRAAGVPTPHAREMPGIAEPHKPRGFSALEREVVRATLAAELEAHAAGQLPWDELYRLMRGSLCVLTSAELVRFGKGLVKLLEG